MRVKGLHGSLILKTESAPDSNRVCGGSGIRGAELAVLLPVLNAEATLADSLNSLLWQTHQAFHLVAVDDGSTDRTAQILEESRREWSRESGCGWPRLTILRHAAREGIVRSLKDAVAAAGGAAIFARHDADDTSHPERFERQIACLRDNPGVGLVAAGVETVSDAAPTDGWLRYEAWLDSCRSPGEIAANLWIESPLPHPTVMMRRTAYEKAGGYRSMGWPEDYDLWLRMLRAGICMAKLPERLVKWRDHPGRASRTLPEYSADRFLACKAHHLTGYLGGRPAIVWGAGRDGRRAARALLDQGQGIEGFLDIDPHKIGRTGYGRPIFPAESWVEENRERVDRPIVLVSVGTSGARGLIRARLAEAGYREGPDFLCMA